MRKVIRHMLFELGLVKYDSVWKDKMRDPTKFI